MNRFVWQSLDPVDRAKVIAGQYQDMPKLSEVYRQIACEDAEQRALQFDVARSQWN